jgi:hypothetical protein
MLEIRQYLGVAAARVAGAADGGERAGESED